MPFVQFLLLWVIVIFPPVVDCVLSCKRPRLITLRDGSAQNSGIDGGTDVDWWFVYKLKGQGETAAMYFDNRMSAALTDLKATGNMGAFNVPQLWATVDLA